MMTLVLKSVLAALFLKLSFPMAEDNFAQNMEQRIVDYKNHSRVAKCPLT